MPPDEGCTDAPLVRRAQLGEQDAFGALVARHEARVRAWLAHLCGDPVTADDLAQDAFVRAWTRIRRLRDAGKFSAWLMKIAYSEFLQHHRSKRRRRRLLDAFARERNSLNSDASVSTNDLAEAAAADCSRVIAVMSPRERAVVVLNGAFGYSHAEIAKLTGWRLGTVKSLIRRGMRKAREQVEPQGGA